MLQQFLRGITVFPDKKEILIKVKSPLPKEGMDFELGYSVGRPEGC